MSFRWLVIGCLLGWSASAFAQEADSVEFDPSGHFVVYTGDGEPTDVNAVVSAMENAYVVFIGERHDDPTGHALELMLLEAANEEYGTSRRVVLGMEMFESDVQPVLNEYLSDYIREKDFLKASRPWGNYESDYRPMVEYARENGIPVVGTNAPARYTSLARRRGLIALDSLMSSSFYLPHELPLTGVSRLIDPPSSAYEAKFIAEMEEMGSHGSMPGMPSAEDMLVAQNLRDATMAFWIGRQLIGRSLVLHVNGAFHSENRLGIPEHLMPEFEAIPMLFVTMRPVEDIHTAPEPSHDDYIILTDEGLIED